jgi:hypothetical protein
VAGASYFLFLEVFVVLVTIWNFILIRFCWIETFPGTALSLCMMALWGHFLTRFNLPKQNVLPVDLGEDRDDHTNIYRNTEHNCSTFPPILCQDVFSFHIWKLVYCCIVPEMCIDNIETLQTSLLSKKDICLPDSRSSNKRKPTSQNEATRKNATKQDQ